MPLMIDLRKKKVLIIGGGRVGERKARLFSYFAKEVTVMSKDFSKGIKKLAECENVHFKRVDVENNFQKIEESIKNSFIVVIATDSKELNEKIVECAKKYGKMVNRAATNKENEVYGDRNENEDDRDRENGDFIVPSIIKKGDICIGISMCGKSPGMAKFLRERIESEIKEEDEKMVKLQYELRNILKEKVDEQSKREKILASIIKDEEIWSALSISYEKGKEIAMKKYIKSFL